MAEEGSGNKDRRISLVSTAGQVRPFLPDSSRIVQIDLNGNVSPLKMGLTSVADLAIAPRGGNLVFLQFGRWEFPFVPNTGGVFKLHNSRIAFLLELLWFCWK